MQKRLKISCVLHRKMRHTFCFSMEYLYFSGTPKPAEPPNAPPTLLHEQYN